MKVAVFGCSWSHGIKAVNDRYSWPYALSKLKPEWHIENYAVEGTSLAFQTFLMDDVLRHHSFDKIIFQITSPGRITYFEEDYDVLQHVENITSNYKHISIENGFFRKVIAVTPGHMNLPKKDSFWFPAGKYEFSKSYYSLINKSIFRTEYKALVHYILSKANVVFMHNEDILKLNLCPVVMEEVNNDELLKSFIADSGSHFNKVGCDWQANWVLDRL